MDNKTFWVLECASKHADGSECGGLMITHLHEEESPKEGEEGHEHGNFIQIFESEIMAQMAASEEEDEDGNTPRAVQVKIVKLTA